MKKVKILDGSNLNKGITLIALIITIIVLLILAGITLAMVVGDNGIIAKAGTAKDKTNESQAAEENRLADYENKIDQYSVGNRGGLGTELLPETVVYEGQEYTLNGSIDDYKSIKMFGGVNTSASKADCLWSSTEFPTKNIVLYNDNNTNRTFCPIWMGSNTSYYAVLQITFTDKNKIKIYSKTISGWPVPSDGVKLIIYGN